MYNTKAQGFFSWVVLNEDGKVVSYSKDKNPNLILNQGLNGIAVRTWAESFISCAVGNGATTPSPNQIGLTNEVKRTAVYLDMEDACSASIQEDNFVLKRTFVFDRESSSATYKEAGFSYSLLAGNNLFSRVSLPSIQVETGQRLVIQYELYLKITQATPTQVATVIKNVPSSGIFQFQKIGLYGIDSAGVSLPFDEANGCNEPSKIANGFLSPDSSAPTSLGLCVDRSENAFEKVLSLSSYSQGTYRIIKTLSLGNTEGRHTWRSLGVGSPSQNGLVCVLDENFTKGFGALTINFTYTWSSYNVNKFAGLYYWQDEENMFLRGNPLLTYFDLSNA